MKSSFNPHIIVIVSFALLLCSFTTISTAEEIALYVSTEGNDTSPGSISAPFATIEKARDAIRAIKKEGALTKPVTVYIRGGLYELDETIVFTLEDSGTKECPITYTAYKDEEPVISGGRKITAPWKDYEGRIKVCTIPEAKEGEWQFKQLFLNGERQIRARMPNDSVNKNGTFYQTEGVTEEDPGRDAFKFRGRDFKQWKNLNDVTVVLFHSWNASRVLISELDEEEKVVIFSGPFGRRLGGSHRYYIENVLEGLDQPGEWYLDRHTGQLYYWPDGDLEDAQIRAPVLNELVRFEGDLENKNYIQYINILGLTFCEGDYNLPKEGIPTIRDVGDIWFPAAITMKGVSDCVFEDNTIRNTGTYALDLIGDGNHITGNTIYDTGSGGIITRSYGKHRNVITRNHIHHCGSVFHSAVGINIDDGGGLIANNLIHDISHSEIYTRYSGSGSAIAYEQERHRRNQEQGLIIEYNEIHDVMQVVSDGGGIFVRDDYVLIRNNLIYSIFPHSDAYAIYLGCETRNCLVENNVVYDVGVFGQYVWRDNKNNTIFNNIYVGATTPVAFINPTDQTHRSDQIRFLRNIVYFSTPSANLYDFPWFGGDERSLPMESDYNIIYHTEGKELRISGYEGVETFEDWKQLGLDTHSIIADPLFVDPENHDYSLRPDSPALKMGFKPIDLSRVGLRGRK